MHDTGASAGQRDGVGGMLRGWRQRRRLSQLHLALEAGISQRHLSFVESGRASPSREMVLTLAETLSVPLRERNRLLLAAGYAPSFADRPLDAPELQPAMAAVQRILDGHAPNPALAIDRYWNILLANSAVPLLLAGVRDHALLAPPVNALRLSLHPGGLAPDILNFAQWRAHVLERLRGLNEVAADPVLGELERELAGYPVQGVAEAEHEPADPIAVPLRIRVGDAELSFITTTTVFGAPLDITLSELAIESFFPADETTARFLRTTRQAG